MPVLKASDYNPPLLWKNPHINTIYPYFFRIKHPVKYTRIRLETPDHDFVDIDTVINGNQKLAILLHGLEGSAQSQYILGTAYHLIHEGWDIAAFNFRSCSGEINRGPVLYHSGFTQDLHMTLQYFSKDYQNIAAVGFSLGGNVLMKYLGDGIYTIPSALKVSAGVSVPCDLAAGSKKIARPENYLYQKNFLLSLLKKMKMKHRQFPELIAIKEAKRVKTLIDFDHAFTAPVHGFADAWDYYDKANSLQFLSHIKIPSLMINALDDSFLPRTSYPYEIAQSNPSLHLLTPRYGGHVGFTTTGSMVYWNEQKIGSFLNTHLG